MIIGPGVFIEAKSTAAVLDLAMAEVERRRVAGELVGSELVAVLQDLAAVARAFRDSPVPTGSVRHPARCRGPILHGVTTAQAASALGISERAVRKRIEVGSLHAERRDGRWLVELPEESPCRA